MANCNACEDLRNDAAVFTQNGVNDSVCASLKNNTGFSPTNGNDNCTDLNNANDCLIQNMVDEVEKHDVCDWKAFMRKLLPNIYTMLKAMICAICGVWARLETLECRFDSITQPQSFTVTESNIRWAPGVTKNPNVGSDGTLSIPAITGNAYAAYMTGSISITDSYISNHPNSSLNKCGALLYEYRVKLSDHNLSRMWGGNMQENAAGKCVHAHIYRFKAGETTYGNDGYTGTGSTTVPPGYEYLQVRLSSYDTLANNMTLSGVLPVLMLPKTNC